MFHLRGIASGFGISLFAWIPDLLRFLLGRTPFRRLSQTLIITLLLIAPVSFSTDKIPNFKPDCQTSAFHKEKAFKTVVVARRSVVLRSRSFHWVVKTQLSLVHSPTPPTGWFHLPSHSRAPPLHLSPT